MKHHQKIHSLGFLLYSLFCTSTTLDVVQIGHSQAECQSLISECAHVSLTAGYEKACISSAEWPEIFVKLLWKGY